jgi:hypothetical protein
MKKSITAVLAFLSLFFLISGCTTAVQIDENGAVLIFLEWLTDIGIPQNPDTPMLGLLLEPVTAGSIVSTVSGYDEADTRNSGRLSESGWLFYLDQTPGGLYQHPGKIVVVGTGGQILYSEETNGWPLVDDALPNVLRSVTSDLYYQAIVWNPYGMLKPSAGSTVIDPGTISIISKGAIVINGVIQNEPAYQEAVANHARVVQAMQALFTPSKVRSITSAVKSDSTPAYRIGQAIYDLIVNEGITHITLYICGHGGIGDVSIAGHVMTATAFRNSVLSNYPDIHFSLILESCYSGNYLTRLSGEFAVDNLEFMVASAMWNQSSYTDTDTEKTASNLTVNDLNPQDAFVEWTSDFLLKLAEWSVGEKWNQVQQYAREYGIDFEPALFYHCFWDVKGSALIPPASGFNPGNTTQTIKERSGVETQTPRVYARWVSETPTP